ncbi:MAG: hypothetical protein GXO77_08430 [Calditrichaeota bacterium]|nr:hypothetical protein [Calditrichota bacterium]
MNFDGLTRDASGKRTDKTGARDLTFSRWHRDFLSRRCYATDIDFLEYRIENGEFVPKAFIEIKKSHVKQKKYLCSANTRAVLELARRAGIRFFIILYDKPSDDARKLNFWVWEVQSPRQMDLYNEKRFDEFFERYSNDQLVSLIERL